MVTPLLETKLYVPKWRRGLVPRRRLSDRLNRGAEAKLTLVSAPAGFGKTTLLAEWLATAPADQRSTSCRPRGASRRSRVYPGDQRSVSWASRNPWSVSRD